MLLFLRSWLFQSYLILDENSNKLINNSCIRRLRLIFVKLTNSKNLKLHLFLALLNNFFHFVGCNTNGFVHHFYSFGGKGDSPRSNHRWRGFAPRSGNSLGGCSYWAIRDSIWILFRKFGFSPQKCPKCRAWNYFSFGFFSLKAFYCKNLIPFAKQSCSFNEKYFITVST